MIRAHCWSASEALRELDLTPSRRMSSNSISSTNGAMKRAVRSPRSRRARHARQHAVGLWLDDLDRYQDS